MIFFFNQISMTAGGWSTAHHPSGLLLFLTHTFSTRVGENSQRKRSFFENVSKKTAPVKY